MIVRWIPVVMTMLVSCSVGPDYKTPDITVSSTFGASDGAVLTDETDDLVDWWRRLGDADLDRAIELALEHNHDLRVATARLAEVHALRRATASARGPSVGGGADFVRSRQSENTILGNVFSGGAGVGLTQNQYTVGLDASWELDVFGGVRRQVEGAEARVQSSEQQWRGVRLAVVGEVARVWVERAGTRRSLAIAEEQVALQSNTLSLVESRVESGLARKLEIDRARAQLEATRSAIPALRASLAAQSHRLSVLLGREPAATVDGGDALPSVPPTIAVGVPADLLRRRPDVLAAERELAAASADIGVAVAELYPKFFLAGSAGYQSLSSGDLLDPGSRIFQLGPAVRWRLFESGRLDAQVDAREAAFDARVAVLERTVLIALEEVESSAVAHRRERERMAMLSASAEAARTAAGRARSLYEAGLVDFLEVLDAERERNRAELDLVGSEVAVRTTAVVLFKALGGGWAEQSD